MKISSTLFIGLFSLQASAQLYVKMPWQKKHERFPALSLVHQETPPPALVYNASFNTFKTDLGRSRYSTDAEEAMYMRDFRHSIRYGKAAMRIQFDSLANFYLRQNRFSEAKWYVLRSNAISREQKNYDGIIGSLVVLADVKSNLGDFKQAGEDLTEAKNIAASHGLIPNLLLIEQHAKQMEQNKQGGIKLENHYAELL